MTNQAVFNGRISAETALLLERARWQNLRRYQSVLEVTGRGVIVFGVWSVLKGIMLLTLGAVGVDYYGLESSGPMSSAERIATYIGILIALAIDLLLRLYLGRSALAESGGKRKSYAYLVVAALFTVTSMTSVAYTAYSGFRAVARNGASAVVDALTVVDQPGLLDQFASLVLDFTSGVTTLRMVMAAVRVKRLSKALMGAGKKG